MPDNIIKNAIETEFTKEELQRYSRHLVIPEVGLEGQKKLKEAKVLVIGAGGLGSPICLYLAAAGVGKIGIVDFDTVSLSNLQRQVLYNSNDERLPNTEIAGSKLKELKPNTEIVTYNVKLTKDNALEIIKDYDIVADGSDNFATRYLVNDACVILKKPVVYGSILKFEGQVSVFDSTRGPCYRCLYPEPSAPGEIPSCEEGGVLGVLPGIIGSLQANEVIKYILGKGDLLTGRLLMFDALKVSFREIKVYKNDECPVCGENPTITGLIDYEEFCLTAGASARAGNYNSNTMAEQTNSEITVEELKAKIDNGEQVNLLDIRQKFETQIATIGGMVIPVNTLLDRLDEIEKYKDDELIVYCHSGINSHYAVEFLKEKAGFKKAKNLIGGITEWANKIDPEMKKY